MGESWAPLDSMPVSVHAPFVCYPGEYGRHEYADEREEMLLAALEGVALGGYDRWVLHWLSGWDVGIVGTVVSLLGRTRHTAIEQARRAGGELR